MPTTDTVIDILRAVFDGSSALNVNAGGSSAFATRTDETPGGITYVGKAAVGSATGSAVWQIQRLTETSGDLVVQWADGNASFDNTWDNRASLSYS